MNSSLITVLTIKGLVQGVGFRPFIYRIATDMGIVGEVDNRNNGVSVRAVLTDEQCRLLIHRIRAEHPRVASIHSIQTDYLPCDKHPYTNFRIVPSCSLNDEITQVSPDIAVCDDCLADRHLQKHRLEYPFINCTHCGPRFSIIQDLPYDRKQTTMSGFRMCTTCHTEYTTVSDRRFHAQPVACNSCGPIYYATWNNQSITDYRQLLEISVSLLASGEVIAVKGMGGYHLVCDATQPKAVEQLRAIKKRDSKPFAVMFGTLDELKQYVSVNSEEEVCLTSWRRPIVLLRQRKALPEAINPGFKTLGCMLPYMPIHYDWFERLETSVLVMTSGNLSDLPITISPEEADTELKDKVAFILHHNREIYNRVDDSVLQVCGGLPCLIRRSRGYVPEPFFADVPVEGLLAFGAEKTSTFALGKGETVIQSQYIGDLKNYETFQFYTESLLRFVRLFRFKPQVLVCDLHPDYFSSREAVAWATERQLPLIKVQHHHAHAAACMLEYGLHEPVLAWILDGTGLGDDGKVWGGELFYCDRKEYKRLTHLEYIPMPGGDKVASEPWRMALACLWHYWGTEAPLPIGFRERIGEEKIELLIRMMERKVNCPETSSCGRLFDAIASLLGVCDYAGHQAEAPVKLEQLADDEQMERYPVVINEDAISLKPLFAGLLEDLRKGVAVDRLSACFHNTLAYVLFDQACYWMRKTDIKQLVLSGGCFQNKRLTEQLQQLFKVAGIELYVPSRIPCNDSGIAAGQLAVASGRLQNQLINI